MQIHNGYLTNTITSGITSASLAACSTFIAIKNDRDFALKRPLNTEFNRHQAIGTGTQSNQGIVTEPFSP